jgi:hypothetical protein
MYRVHLPPALSIENGDHPRKVASWATNLNNPPRLSLQDPEASGGSSSAFRHFLSHRTLRRKYSGWRFSKLTVLLCHQGHSWVTWTFVSAARPQWQPVLWSVTAAIGMKAPTLLWHQMTKQQKGWGLLVWLEWWSDCLACSRVWAQPPHRKHRTRKRAK